MGAELETLAASAATTLIGLMTTEAWQQARSTISRMWKKARPEQADRITADLDDAEVTVAAARHRQDDAVEAAVLAEWQSRIRGLVLTHPAARVELEGAVRQLATSAGGTNSNSVSMHADARDQARINQAARDVVIRE